MRPIPLQRPEVALIGAFGVVAVVLLMVLKMASEIAEGDMIALDSKILLGMRQLTGGDGSAISALRAITVLGNTPTLAIVTALASCALLLMRQPDRSATLLVGAAAGSGAVMLLKQWIDRVRPDIVPHLTMYDSASYPSGHAANGAIVYLTIAALFAQEVPTIRRRVAILVAAIALVIVIGLSRLFLGVHWPTDVFAGWIFGAAWALACWTFGWWLRTRKAEML